LQATVTTSYQVMDPSSKKVLLSLDPFILIGASGSFKYLTYLSSTNQQTSLFLTQHPKNTGFNQHLAWGRMLLVEAAAAEVWKNLISIEASQNASTSRRRNQEDLNDPTLDFEDTTNLYMEKFYQAHQPNLNYEKNFPIFIDPTDPNQYIPLMLATNTCVELIFANENLFRTWGLMGSKKCKINHETSGSNDVGKLLVNLLTSKNKVGSPSPSDGSQSSDSEKSWKS
ncbi:uncharacterized protein VP01_7634g1, partial [Puccinia sorghi]